MQTEAVTVKWPRTDERVEEFKRCFFSKRIARREVEVQAIEGVDVDAIEEGVAAT
jgi:hypothetical protein